MLAAVPLAVVGTRGQSAQKTRWIWDSDGDVYQKGKKKGDFSPTIWVRDSEGDYWYCEKNMDNIAEALKGKRTYFLRVNIP